MSISVIVPAYNEEKYLCETLQRIQRAKQFLLERAAVATEVIVVDNGSTDSTSDVAKSCGASVVEEPQHNIARVRNAGASASKGDVLVFVDADTIVPEQLLWRINEVMTSPACFGGAVDTNSRPSKTLVSTYLKLWKVVGRLAGMAQGATQFCRRDVFVSLNGYDESIYLGEDVEFHWRMKRIAKRQNARVSLIEDIQVIPSARRFDQWPLWRTLIWTNPLFVLAFRRKGAVWRGWYKVTPR